MSDPLDLEALKKWTEARKDLAGDLFVNHFGYGGVDRDNFIEVCERVYQRGLERAIEIAEHYRARNDYPMLTAERDNYKSRAEDAEKQRDQARQDVLVLRDALRTRACKAVNGLAGCPGCEALEATAHYEQHRKTQEGEA